MAGELADHAALYPFEYSLLWKIAEWGPATIRDVATQADSRRAGPTLASLEGRGALERAGETDGRVIWAATGRAVAWLRAI